MGAPSRCALTSRNIAFEGAIVEGPRDKFKTSFKTKYSVWMFVRWRLQVGRSDNVSLSYTLADIFRVL